MHGMASRLPHPRALSCEHRNCEKRDHDTNYMLRMQQEDHERKDSF